MKIFKFRHELRLRSSSKNSSSSLLPHCWYGSSAPTISLQLQLFGIIPCSCLLTGSALEVFDLLWGPRLCGHVFNTDLYTDTGHLRQLQLFGIIHCSCFPTGGAFEVLNSDLLWDPRLCGHVFNADIYTDILVPTIRRIRPISPYPSILSLHIASYLIWGQWVFLSKFNYDSINCYPRNAVSSSSSSSSWRNLVLDIPAEYWQSSRSLVAAHIWLH